MIPEQVYAIVDIEATGGSIGADERIIQFACVLIKNNKIIHTFESLVNPGKKIPEHIHRLTGISNKDVKKEPFFEEIAPMILSVLENTVFVAHNVGFDLRFLNEQLKAHGFKQIKIPAVDTVELTQILYPTLDSFQLEDIAAFLGYTLENAHDALADANATVHIFKKLFERAIKLPLVTLEKLNELAQCTTHDTFLFFEAALSRAKAILEPLDENLIVLNQIAIQKPKINTNNAYSTWEKNEYPLTKEEKEKYLPSDHQFREVQAEMMDLVFNYFKEDLSLEKLAIEAPPGIGKSIGYMFPSIFKATKENKIVISTYTTLLQEQLLNKTIPKLEEIFDKKIPTTLVKSKHHYLSLSIFERWMKEILPNDSEAYLSMRILVWLTETETGDLSEMNAGSHLDLGFWQEIRVTNHHFIDPHWKKYDFFERVKDSIEHAEIIITNHHFLVHDWQNEHSVIPSINQLIIDEAHHFPEVASKASTMSIHGIQISSEIEKMGSAIENTGIFKLINQLQKDHIIRSYDSLKMDRNKQLITDLWESLFNRQIEYYENQDFNTRKDSNFVEHEIKLSYFSLKEKRAIKSLALALEEFIHTSFEITKKATEKFNELSNENQLLLIELGKLITYLRNWKQDFRSILMYDKNAPQALRWVSYIPEYIENTFQFHVLKWGESNSFIDYLAIQSKVLFTSSTLSFRDSEDYFSGQLKNIPLNFHQLESPFNYGEQVRVMLPEKRIHPKEIRKNEYSHLLASEITNILSTTNVNTIVLFRSLSVLKEVYQILKLNPDLSNHRILAQSITGTRNRILKNFKRHKPAVILGADSFFEGIDLPNEELELVVLTRLPFPAPNTPMMRLKTDHLNEQGVNPFMGEYLPQAILKFRQAFGRLIRNKTDKGVLVVLDDRFLSASYSKIFKESIPKGVPIEMYPNNELGGKIQAFIDENNQ